ncbi:large subunit GTPase 1 homolog [Rhagoletis pomonella]|uniref:large subunit GTPase 1 homolog n=1 Tax=Rhagoletis pomonella TaxID=28610 RepID=UPI001783A1FB|nr:large subunit GTPase 1 homolog [Rhagoletis pomonella]
MSKKSKTKSGDLGRALIKNRFGHQFRRKVDNETMLHTTEIQDGYDWGRLNLASVTEESSFHDFLRTAELAGTEFQAEKLNITFINPKSGVGLLSKTQQKQIEEKHIEHRNMLTVPRRPKWTAETTAEELQRAENESFLEWRRSLALLQEDQDILLTPYEKNLEFWRQLWRVVERSDVIVQIVDARNPLLFRNLDLERYVKEVNPAKMNMILVNKSDMLTEQQRKHWAAYFDAEGIRTAFFSATMAAEELKTINEESGNEQKGRQEIDSEADSDSDNDASDADAENDSEAPAERARTESSKSEMSLDDVKAAADEINKSLDNVESLLSKIEQKIDPNATASHKEQIKNDSKVLTREELIDFFKSVYSGKTFTAEVTTIGLVGYPNVGKSSTINALMIEKKVSVSATPGKTKHFQTLYLDNDLLLCDCPGLVMPSFVLTKADMILNGILPIDQMRDHVSPVNLLCERIPRHVLEDKYGIIIAKPMEGEDENRAPHSEELLLAYGYNRGFMTSNGQPDQSRSARYVCKDYVNGKLLYCVAPPNVPQEEYHVFPPKTSKEVVEQKLPNQQQRAMRINTKSSSKEIDKQFFDANNSNAYVKGRSDFPHVRVANDGTVVSGPATEKPWRSVKKERREKLRKKFSHLDQH